MPPKRNPQRMAAPIVCCPVVPWEGAPSCRMSVCMVVSPYRVEGHDPLRSVRYHLVQHSRRGGSAYPPKGGLEGGFSTTDRSGSKPCCPLLRVVSRSTVA